MLGPNMILEDVLYGEELESKREFYKAYWVYMYAESAERREDEAMCLIGSMKDFCEVEATACSHRTRVWKYLTQQEKENARQGMNPFGNIPELAGFPMVSPPYDLKGYYEDFVNEDSERENRKEDSRKSRKGYRRISLIFLLSFILRPLSMVKMIRCLKEGALDD